MRYWPSGILGYTLRLSMLSRLMLREGRNSVFAADLDKRPSGDILASPPLTYNHSSILPENHVVLQD